LAGELVQILDGMGVSLSMRLVQNPLEVFSLHQEFKGDGSELGIDPKTFEQMKRIWTLVQSSPGADPAQTRGMVLSILTKPGAYEFIQTIAQGLTQKAIARFTRQWFAV